MLLLLFYNLINFMFIFDSICKIYIFFWFITYFIFFKILKKNKIKTFKKQILFDPIEKLFA